MPTLRSSKTCKADMTKTQNLKRTSDGQNGSHSSTTKKVTTPTSPFRVSVSMTFVTISIILSLSLAFTIGRIARTMLMRQLLKQQQPPSTLSSATTIVAETSTDDNSDKLPPIILSKGDKEFYIPKTTHTTKNFDSTTSVFSTGLLISSSPDDEEIESKSASSKENQDQQCAADDYECKAQLYEVPLSLGQHILIDMMNVNTEFLNSEYRLASAIIETCTEAKLTLLSYHCHKLQPMGVTCVAIMPKAHISFHTWPEEGVITLDLYTSQSSRGPEKAVLPNDDEEELNRDLLHILPIVERVFGVPRNPYSDDQDDKVISFMTSQLDKFHSHGIETLWSYKLRGFKEPLKVGKSTLTSSELGDESTIGPMSRRSSMETYEMKLFLLGMMDIWKKEVLSSKSQEGRQIEIYDVINPRFHDKEDYLRSKLKNNPTLYQSQHPEFFEPDRMLFIDGILQSTSRGFNAYHEALVHPAMFAHPEPKNIGILSASGTEGTTLRELLKHNTVESLLLIPEKDELLMNISKQYLADWSDCSNFILPTLTGSSDSCLEDDRVSIEYGKYSLDYFIENFFEKQEKPKMDVIIMDLPDPQEGWLDDEDGDYVDELYNNNNYLKSIYNALSDDGILVIELGESPDSFDAPEYFLERNKALTIQNLEECNFESIHLYEDSHGGFFGPWSYLVAFKDIKSKAQWYSNEAEVELAMHKRSVQTKSGESPFDFFDGASMVSWQNPHRVFENSFCKQVEIDLGDDDDNSSVESLHCKTSRGFDPYTPITDSSSFAVKKSTQGESSGRGVFATVDIPKGAYSVPKDNAEIVKFPPKTYNVWTETFYNLKSEAAEMLPLEAYLHGYGFTSEIDGAPEVQVDSGLLAFANHGCDGNYNLGIDTGDITEKTASLEKMPNMLKKANGRQKTYNPVIDRHRQQHYTTDEKFLKDVKAGDEILTNYLAFVGSEKWWKGDVSSLRDQCNGKDAGDISYYEDQYSN